MFEQVDDHLKKLHKNLKLYVKMLNYVTILWVVLLLICVITVSVYAIIFEIDELKIAELVVGCTFSLLAVLFGITGWLILKRL